VQQTERREIQVVAMTVGDEDDVRPRRRLRERHRAAKMGHPVAQQRVREDADAVQLQEDGCVPDVTNDQ
jgi:hypothetical protein